MGVKNGITIEIMLAVCMVTQGAFSTTWYVSTSGNDANAGTSESVALKTIQTAVDKAAPNDVIFVAKGSYSCITIPESKRGLSVKATGTVAETIIKGSSKQRCVTIADGSVTNIYVEGFTLTGADLGRDINNDKACGAGARGGTYNNCVITGNTTVRTGAGALDCTLNGCTISNNTCLDWVGGIENCIAINCVINGNKSTYTGSGGASNCLLIECRIMQNSGGPNGTGGGGVQNCVLYRCFLENNTRNGIYTAGQEIYGGTACDCVIKANKGDHTIAAAKCYNCTIVSTTGSPSIWLDTYLYNCIVSSTGNAFWINGGDNGKVYLYNCLLNNVSLGSRVTKSGCITAAPNFVNASDFNLQNTSPCIDKGNNSYVSTTMDYAGNQRILNGNVDIGAYEYVPRNFSVTVENVRQRYPWNGKIDVAFTLVEENGYAGNVSISARDVVGNTNLPMQTIYKDNGTAVNTAGETLLPGTYNWVWDAVTDLPRDFKCDRVTVEVKAE